MPIHFEEPGRFSNIFANSMFYYGGQKLLSPSCPVSVFPLEYVQTNPVPTKKNPVSNYVVLPYLFMPANVLQSFV